MTLAQGLAFAIVFTPVGAGIAIAGFLFLLFGWRLLPRDRKGAASMDTAFNLVGYTTEVTVPEDSPAAGVTVKALEELGEGETEVITLIRAGARRYEPAGNVVIKSGDILILQGEPTATARRRHAADHAPSNFQECP